MAGRTKKKSTASPRKRSRKSSNSSEKKRRNSGSPSKASSSPTKAVGSPNKRAKRDTSEHTETSNSESLLVDVLSKSNMNAVKSKKSKKSAYVYMQ